MTERVVSSQRQSSPLLGIGGLKSGVTAIGVRAKLIDVPKSLIERPLVRKRSKAPVANRLIAIELHLERLMESSCAYKIHPQIPAQAHLLLNAQVVLVVIRCFERSTREGVQADCQRACRCTLLNSRARRAAGAKNRLERIVRIHGSIDCAPGHTGSETNAADLATNSPNKRRIVGGVHGGKIGNLHGNNVVEDSKSAVNRHLRKKLICDGNPRLVDKQRRGGKQVMDISQYNLVQRLLAFMGGVKEGACCAGEEVPSAGDVGVPGCAHAVGNRGLVDGLKSVHRIVFEIARRNSLL